MLEYAARLTMAPWTVEERDVTRMREAGLSDRAILDINLVTGYYAFANRLADGLGVPLEEFWEK
jgi:alkylhydroperoxidase family enzyme